MRTITIPTCPYEKGQRLYLRKDATFTPGKMTVLVGCNGSGKSTLMTLIKDALKKDKNVLCLSYDDRHNGGSNLMSKFGFYNRYDWLSEMMLSSEGEKIMIGFGDFISNLRRRISENNPKEIWIFLDAVGSGLSIDKIKEIKEFIPVVIEDNVDRDVYVIVSTNEFEFAKCEDCLDVTTFRHMTFSDYDSYLQYILITRARKDRRERKIQK